MPDEEERFDIRRPHSDDGGRIRELNESAMARTPEYVPDAPDADLLDVTSHYIEVGGEFLVGTVDGTIVATGAYAIPDTWKEEYVDLDRGTAEVTRMRVDPERQGNGFGTAIYHELERRARADGFRRFVLDTGADNAVARGFYESLGFECHRVTAIDFGEVELELALYQKSIDG